MNHPLVSVVVPIYGVEQYIEKCAKSLLNQTYENIQYVFVNDCTKDNSIDILKSEIDNHPLRKPCVKIINNKTNQGLGISRHIGINNSDGEYIIFIDSDDWIELEMVEKMVTSIVETKSDIVATNFYKNSDEVIKYNKIGYSTTHEYICNMFLLKVSATLWNKIYKKNLFENIRYPKDNMHEDLYINLQLFKKAGKVYHIEESLYHYRENPNSITHNYPLQQSINNLLNIKKYIESECCYDLYPAYYSFLNYVKSFALKKVRPLDFKQIDELFSIDKKAEKYIFQKTQFNNIQTQILLFMFTLCYKCIKGISHWGKHA